MVHKYKNNKAIITTLPNHTKSNAYPYRDKPTQLLFTPTKEKTRSA